MTEHIVSCDNCREMVSAKSDGELAELDPAVGAHLASCAECRAFEEGLDAVRSALRGWPDEHPRDVFRPVAHFAPRATRLATKLAAAAVLVVAIAAGFAAGRATAPAAEGGAGSAITAPAHTPPIERERFVVPGRNEVHSTISLAAVQSGGRPLSPGSQP